MKYRSHIPTFTMMVGLPGSGKSTYAKLLAGQTGAIYLSTDELRKELTGAEDCFDKDREVFSFIRRTAKESLLAGNDVIYDATNRSAKKRMSFLSELGKIPCVKRCIIVATPYAVCLKNNLTRERHVPESAIEEMYRSFVIPYYFEGWNDIDIHYNKPEYETLHGFPESFAARYLHFPQDNHNHTETLGEHSLWTYRSVIDAGHYATTSLSLAAIIHDCGKPVTKAFQNLKGEETADAHFYGHQNVGGYEALFFDIPMNQRLEVAAYVCYHMEPYFWKGEQIIEKKRKLWGESFYNAIMALHDADDRSRTSENEMEMSEKEPESEQAER